MERVLIKDIKDCLGKEITALGRIIGLRKMGGLTFVILQDYTGQIQAVFEKEPEAKFGEAVMVAGKPRQDERAKGGFEIEGQKLEVIAKARCYSSSGLDFGNAAPCVISRPSR